jgi:hypothetical protein
MIVVGDGSYIPIYLHDLAIKIGEWQVAAPIGFSERLGAGFNILDVKASLISFKSASTITPEKYPFKRSSK